jgi:hypothetical protein
MSTESPFPQVEVAIVVIERAGLFLVEYNPNWHSFTLPATRLRRRPAGVVITPEPPLDAAARAAAQALGRPLPPNGLPQPVSLDVLPLLHTRSGRDSNTKRYVYHVFKLRTAEPSPRHALGWLTLWMKRADLLTHRPVSPTAVFVCEHLDENAL